MTDCIFCKIAGGEFNTPFIVETEDYVAFNDINPKADTHVLVVPKKHYDSLNELDDEIILGKLLGGVKRVAAELGLKSYKTVINTGKDAGQEVFHLHIHVLSGNIKGV